MNIDERVVPGISNTFNLQKHIARYNFILSEAKEKSVLDLACGTGYGSFLMSLVAKTVCGIDISREAIDFARNSFIKDRLVFLKKDILDFSSKPQDLIISFETVEHIKDLEKLEKKFSTLLKSGGKLIYSVPLYENYNNPYHIHKFTAKTGLAIFPSLKLENAVIQDGLNFSNIDNKKPFTYLIVSKTKL